MATFAGTISEVKVIKTGEGQRGPWTLWAVFAIPEGASAPQKFTTFLDRSKQVGQKVTFSYEVKKNGEYTDYRILEPKPQRRNGQGPGDSGLILDKLGTLESKVDLILDYIGRKERRA